MKWGRWLMIAAVVTASAPLYLYLVSHRELPVMQVNGYSISSREFILLLEQQRAETTQYFHRKYGSIDVTDFWTRSYDGEIPIQHARSAVVDKLIQIKVKQGLAEQVGLRSFTTYDEFVREFMQENQRRNETVQKGGIIYGPEQYGEMEYYDYYQSNLYLQWIQAKLTLAQADERQLREEYDRIKTTYYATLPTIETAYVSFPYTNEFSRREDALIKARKMQSLLKQGETPDPQALQSKLFSPESFKYDEENIPIAVSAVVKLTQGTWSDIIEENGSFTLYFCKRRTEGAFRPYDEMKEDVKRRWVERESEELIQQAVRRAKVEVNDQVLGQIYEHGH